MPKYVIRASAFLQRAAAPFDFPDSGQFVLGDLQFVSGDLENPMLDSYSATFGSYDQKWRLTYSNALFTSRYESPYSQAADKVVCT